MYEEEEPSVYISQLQKLKTIEGITALNISFLLGYLTAPIKQITTQHFIAIRKVIEQAEQLARQSVITPDNRLEIIITCKLKVIKNDQKGNTAEKIVQFYNATLTELALDRSHLFKIHFERNKKKHQANEKIKSEMIESYEKLGIECPICISEINHRDLCILRCDHSYHKQCFNQYSKEKIRSKIFPIICPSEDCGKEIDTKELQEYLIQENKDKYYQFAFHQYVDKNMADTSWCPTPGCKAVFCFDQYLLDYDCPVCSKHYCLQCKCEMHYEQICEEYQATLKLSEEEKKFISFVKGAKFKQCPNCKFWVEKSQGCDHMTCRCQYEFCYICGAQYGSCDCMDEGSEGSEPHEEPDEEPDEEPHEEEREVDEEEDDDAVDVYESENQDKSRVSSEIKVIPYTNSEDHDQPKKE